VQLLTAIRHHDGFCLLTGELGVGKTTLCRAIVSELDTGIASSIVLEPVADADALVKMVLVDYGVLARDDQRRAARMTREERLQALAAFFDSLPPSSSAVIVLDEAHRQPPAVIAQLLALATGAGAGRLQVVLVGPPSFAATLKTPALRVVDSVMTARCELRPLAADEIAGYVLHRLAVAAAGSRVDFDEAALQQVYDLSRGVPAVVNVLCDGALAGGFERSASTIDVTLVNAAAVALDVSAPTNMEHRTVRTATAVAALLALMLLGAAGAAWVFRDAVARTIALWERVPPAPAPPAPRVAPIRPPQR
jgi:general secretion pathway protein A